jgi:hypothetical protein
MARCGSSKSRSSGKVCIDDDIPRLQVRALRRESSTGLKLFLDPASSISGRQAQQRGYRPSPNASRYRHAIRDSRIASVPKKLVSVRYGTARSTRSAPAP